VNTPLCDIVFITKSQHLHVVITGYRYITKACMQNQLAL